jgi:hypothetical protein
MSTTQAVPLPAVEVGAPTGWFPGFNACTARPHSKKARSGKTGGRRDCEGSSRKFEARNSKFETKGENPKDEIREEEAGFEFSDRFGHSTLFRISDFEFSSGGLSNFPTA